MSVVTYSRITGIQNVDLEEKYVRTTRFEIISSGTSGTVTLPENSEVVLDDFGGTTDAIISAVSGGRPTYEAVYTSLGAVVATTFNSSADYSLSGTPSGFPVAIIFRVRQKLKDFDSDSSNIIGGQDALAFVGVTSVNGKSGVVSLTTFDIPEDSTNKYYTDSRVKAQIPGSFGSSVDGQGGLPTIQSYYFKSPSYAMTITRWDVQTLHNQTGTTTMDLKISSTSIIGGGNAPSISTQSENHATIASWTTVSIPAFSVIELVLSTASGNFTGFGLTLSGTRN